jgi:hypothetical protein
MRKRNEERKEIMRKSDETGEREEIIRKES